MRIVAALGGNALLRRGQPPRAELQRSNLERAAGTLGLLAREHELIVTYGNGPQIGLLALANEAIDGIGPYPLDILGAESQGLVGYLIVERLAEVLPDAPMGLLVTRVRVAEKDPAFLAPSKPIGPGYPEDQARELAASRGWTVAPDNAMWRRVVPSPEPIEIVDLDAIRTLVERGVLVVCAGGGGIPVTRRMGRLTGVEAVIDKDLTSEVLARELEADVLLMLTDVLGVATSWPDSPKFIARAGAEAIADLSFPAGSMGPKVTAAIRFASHGGRALIARLQDAALAIRGEAGTEIVPGDERITFRSSRDAA